MRIRRGTTGWPMWTRLLGLVLVPLVGMMVVARPVIHDRSVVADSTAAAEEQVTRLSAVLGLRFAIRSEFVPAETTLRAQAFGLSPKMASTLLGFDLDEELPASRAAVDAALAAWPSLLPYPDDVEASLAEVRRQVDAGTATIDGIHAVYLSMTARLTTQSERLLETALVGAVGVGNRGEDLEIAVQQLIDAYELVAAGDAEIDAVFQLLVARDGVDPAAVRRDLLVAATNYRERRERLVTSAASTSPVLDAALSALRRSPDAIAVDAAIDRRIVEDTPAGIADVATVFRASFARSELFRDIIDITAADAAELSNTSSEAARRDLVHMSLLLAGLMVATVVAALAIAWSVTRRLRPLAHRAQDVSTGRLDGPPADERGPREITLAARALNETVANLRHVESQAAALARGDLDDAALARPAPGPLGTAIHATVQELSKAWREGEELHQRLAHQANHDLLTSLPNRKAALEALDHALGRAHRHGEAVWVLFCDLDGFKRANDTFGHHIGDRILRACADRLAGSVRSGDVVARLGGDEFVVITERLTSVREAAELARRLIAVVSEPIALDGVSTRVGLSVGIGMSIDGRATALELLRDADNAVHRAKKQGKGCVEVFDERARDELATSTELEQALRAALEAGELTLHYQPVTDTVTGEVHGLEALARWQRDGVPVSPAEFIPVAEQSDLVNDLGRWALRTATRQLAEWTAAGRFTDAYVSVNVSGRHLLSPALVGDVRAALDESGLDASRLIIEITETVVVNDLVTAVAHLEQVRALGVRVALDDFGTGYTSIGQLWRLPIDVLKIDGSFIRHLETAHDHVIVELMIEVAHTLGLGLVAEGVETTTQQATLRELQCDAIQGFLIARPQPAEQVAASV